MENDRLAYDSIMSERALREIYLMPFMIAQRDAQPWAYMTASVLLSPIFIFTHKDYTTDITA